MSSGARRQYGFTLMEVSIVLLLVAALSGLALGGFNMALERTQANDALQDLTDLVVGMRRCEMLHGAGPPALLPPSCTSSMDHFIEKAALSDKYKTSAYNRSVGVEDDPGTGRPLFKYRLGTAAEADVRCPYLHGVILQPNSAIATELDAANTRTRCIAQRLEMVLL